jgi:Transcriptional activator of glycolytic enzymes
MRVHLQRCADSDVPHGSRQAIQSLLPGLNERLDLMVKGQKEVSDKVDTILTNNAVSADRAVAPVLKRLEAESKRNAQILQDFAVFVSKAASHVGIDTNQFTTATDSLVTTGTELAAAESATEHGLGNDTVGAATVEVEAMEADEISRAKAHHLVVCFPKSVRSLMDEWNGLGDFTGVPIDGGIGRCEQLFGKKWRVGWKNSDEKYLSRMRQVVMAVNNKVEKGSDEQEVVDELNSKLEQFAGFSTFVDWLRNEGWIPGTRKRAPRQQRASQA